MWVHGACRTSSCCCSRLAPAIPCCSRRSVLVRRLVLLLRMWRQLLGRPVPSPRRVIGWWTAMGHTLLLLWLWRLLLLLLLLWQAVATPLGHAHLNPGVWLPLTSPRRPRTRH